MTLNEQDSLNLGRKNIVQLPMVEQVTIKVCCGTGCLANGSELILREFQRLIRETEDSLKFTVVAGSTGCHGFCEHGPIVTIHPYNIFYQKVHKEDVEEIFQKTIRERKLVRRLLYTDPNTKEISLASEEIPFYSKQTRKVLSLSGKVDPESIDSYISLGGYSALAKALFMDKNTVIEEVARSGLRGRGGGGFSTGKKWKSCSEAEDTERYVIANGDEGDPGAFMDRSLMEGDPHSIIEGMIIGGYAIGASRGFIYVRAEYPLAVKHLDHAIKEALERGFLGKNILGGSFSFELETYRGGGAFICGESTALMASIEGKIGEPRVKYIRSTRKGLWGKPTVLNNVETWANIPHIILQGATAFRMSGTEKSPGTKIFSLVGKIKNSGLVEVPMGIPLREIIYGIGGGTLSNRPLKAVQTGGPSGGCIPGTMLDLKVDFDSLTEVGSMMGSGGLIVMDDRTCMVDVARYFIDFLVEESCGKCTPCREGLKEMQNILHRLTTSRAVKGDVKKLREISECLPHTALCGLGKTAANPVISTLRYFPEEYMEHEEDNFCRAGVCTNMFSLTINPSRCIGCHACFRECPEAAIKGDPGQPHEISNNECILCGTCLKTCRFDAIVIGRRRQDDD